MTGRNGKGQFTAGNRASPGRPKKATEAEYLEAMGRGIPLETFEQASAKMGKLAAKGDVQAYNAIKAHLAGLPVQKLQLTTSEVGLLSELLDLMKAKGVKASDVFESMIALLAESDLAKVESDEQQ